MVTVTFLKENIPLELAYSFRGLVHCHQGRKHGGMQTVMLMEKEMRVLHLESQAA